MTALTSPPGLTRAVAVVVGVAAGRGVRPGRSCRRLGRAAGNGRRTCCGRRPGFADYAIPLGLDPAPEVMLHPSVIERFARCAPGLSGVARRTLRTNLRFIARHAVPHLYPADVPLPRERAKQPYSPAQIAGYLALADAQPTLSRRMRASGLVCLGARRRADPRRPARADQRLAQREQRRR